METAGYLPCKRPEWKQITPLNQLVATLSSLEGEFINFEDGDSTKEKLIERGRAKFQELKELMSFLQEPEKW